MSEKTKVLLLDDTEDTIVLQTTILESYGFFVKSAINGLEGLEKLKTFTPDIIVSDVLMPKMDGFEFCRAVKSDEKLKDIPVIFYSAQYTDTSDKALADDVGAEGFMTKPIEIDEFIDTINTILEKSRKKDIEIKPTTKDLEFDKKHYEAQAKMLDRKLQELEDKNIKLQEALKKFHDGMVNMIEAFSLAIEKRDAYTAGHQQRVSKLSVLIAQKLGWDEYRVEGLKLGALIHDIGKLAIPIEILTKPGELLPIEFELIKMHAQVGFDILKDIEFSWPIAKMVHQHHERIDGTGYPLGLKADEIIEEAKILSVADVVEAVASYRPYRPALGIDVAISEIKENRGVIYDSKIVDICLEVLDENKNLFD